jgi:hypothetical protein
MIWFAFKLAFFKWNLRALVKKKRKERALIGWSDFRKEKK